MRAVFRFLAISVLVSLGVNSKICPTFNGEEAWHSERALDIQVI